MEPRRSKPVPPPATAGQATATAASLYGIGSSMQDAAMTSDVVASFSDYPQLQVVFDFFADNPQKVIPSPPGGAGQDLPGTGVDDAAPRQDPYWESIRIMQTSDLFMEGMLLRSVDCKPNFPYMHYIVYKSPAGQTTSDKASRLQTMTSLDSAVPAGSKQQQIQQQELRHRHHHHPHHITAHSPAVVNDVNQQFIDILRHRGSYSEMYTFVSRHTPLLPKRPSNPNTAFIVSAFKTAGNLDSLDRSWTYWSGADYVVEHIPKSLSLERVTFHKLLRHAGQGQGQGHAKDNFSYVLVCEVGEALADLNHAREFVDTLKYRQCGVTSMYVIDHFF